MSNNFFRYDVTIVNEARRAEREPRSGELSPKGAGDAAQRPGYIYIYT